VHDPAYVARFADSLLNDTCCSKHLYRHVALLLCDFSYNSRCGNSEPQAVALLNEAVVQNDDSLAAFILGRHLLGQGLTDRAFEVWAMIDEVTFSRWLVASAENAVDQNQGQYALELASAAVRADPSDPSAHYQLGKALFGQGDLQGAVASLNKALALTDSLTFGCDIHGRIATYFLALGKSPDAVPHLRESARCNPQSAPVQFRLVRALVETKQYEEAEDLLRNPANPLYGTASGYIGLSLIAQKQSDLNQARHWLEIAKQSAPTDPEIEYYLGVFETDQLHHDRALSHFKSAKRLGLSEARIDLAIARSYVALKDYHSALLAYKDLTDQIGDQKRLVGLWVERAELLSSLPEYQDKAEKVWLKVLEIDPTNVKAKKIFDSQ